MLFSAKHVVEIHMC